MTRLPPDVHARLVARLIRCAEEQLREELAREAAAVAPTAPANDTRPQARVGSRRP